MFLSLYWGSELAKRKDESIDAAIGARIRSLRLHQGLTQETLAGKLGITFRVPLERRIAGAEAVGHHKTSMLQD
ncbi:helix-turn-helix domain-containing protein, partial [Pseudomonas sp. RA_35y_Pfl2_P32]|uniref:helix-turn-helix domain-containing protein n=1 Tax=Pseudomonas sp. RA_35y_Pfl2_P32 TaxID=3088705 RepID=UPI0030DC07A9